MRSGINANRTNSHTLQLVKSKREANLHLALSLVSCWPWLLRRNLNMVAIFSVCALLAHRKADGGGALGNLSGEAAPKTWNDNARRICFNGRMLGSYSIPRDCMISGVHVKIQQTQESPFPLRRSGLVLLTCTMSARHEAKRERSFNSREVDTVGLADDT